MSTPTLTQTGSDNFNRSDSSSLGSDWYIPTGSPAPTSPGISSNQWYAEGSSTAECCWNHTVTQDQYCEITFEGNHSPGPANQYIDLVFRRSRSNPNAFFFFSATQGQSGSGLIFLADNLGTLDTSINLNTSLSIGDVLQVAVVGTQVWVWQNGTLVSAAPFSLPAINPTGSSGDAYDLGLNGSAYLLADNWFVGTAALPATLSVSPSSVAWTPCPWGSYAGKIPSTGTQPNGGTPEPVQLTVSNVGGNSSMPWTATSDNPVFLPTPNSGDAGSAPQTVALGIASAHMQFGIVGWKSRTYSGNVTISAGAAGSVVVPVQYIIAGFDVCRN